MNVEKGDAVVVTGALKKVVDFLSTASKEDIRILSSFFTEGASGTADAKKLQKPLKVTNYYQREDTIEVALGKTAYWEEKGEYFSKVTAEIKEEDL